MNSSRLRTVFMLAVMATGATRVWGAQHAAARRTWYAAGMASAGYQLPSAGEGEDLFRLNLAPRVLYFPLDGLGVGADADFEYVSHYTTLGSIGIGPRAAYYLRRSAWMPFAGASFLYLHNGEGLFPGVGTEAGWQLSAGIGVSPVVGSHGTLPVELSFAPRSLTSDYGGGETETNRTSTIGLEVGLGFFLGEGK
jgi:hypothetical protein